MKYRVSWKEISNYSAIVDAETVEEAERMLYSIDTSLLDEETEFNGVIDIEEVG